MEITAEAKKRLSALIEERDAPLAPLAAKIGVSQSTLWNFVYGSTKNFSKIHRLATELKVSLDWILNGDAPARSDMRHGAGRVAEHAAEGFAYEGTAAAAEKNLIRGIAAATAALAKKNPGLADDVFGAIALALWADMKSGRLPQARGKAAAKTIAAEAQKLIAYELGKRGA